VPLVVHHFLFINRVTPPPHPNRANPIPPRTSTSSSLVSPSAPIPTQHTKTPHPNPRPTHQRPTRHTSPLARTLQLLPSPNLVFEPRRWFTSTWRYSIEYEANTSPIRRLRPRHPIPLHDQSPRRGYPAKPRISPPYASIMSEGWNSRDWVLNAGRRGRRGWWEGG